MVFTHRPVEAEDFEKIRLFPQSKREQFFMYPRWSYPVSAEEMREVARGRLLPTVLVDGEQVAAYCNLYHAEGEEGLWLGNVIVSPAHRGRGAASTLLGCMMEQAKRELGAERLSLMCHSVNTAALLLYHKLGFKPYDWSAKTGPDGEKLLLLKLTRSLQDL
ncbi:GNAT family N-acetyltransferase [Paenibacillus sp. S-38]|uniref:GNAT family N-acetyltransferase n=1 Tax=Paenibacillus sp. S-38 TaxID=3416710 RepID=UPI003CE98E3F